MKMLLKNGRKVDPTLVIEPVVEGLGERIADPEDIPINFTDLSSNFKMSGGLKAFEMKTPWKKDGDNREEVELQDPEVYFAVAFSSDVKPEDVVERISCEWGRLNGKKMWLKAIKSFQTETPIALYHLLNTGHQDTILSELKGILEDARDREVEADMFYQWAGHDIPDLGMRLNVPKIPGQDTTAFKGWPRKLQWFRKVLHVECDSNAVPMIKDLVASAKRRGMFKPVWGKNVRISNTAGAKTKPQDLTNMSRYVRRHVNYHSSMIYDGLVGINNLDYDVPFYAESDADRVVGYMSLRFVLYRFIKLSGGHSLFGEIHQENSLASVEVAIPNAPEAETMVAMMNKNIGAFLTHYLKEEGLAESFVTELVNQSIDPQVLHEMGTCTWDKKTKSLTTPEDVEKAKEQEIESAAWYKDEWGSHMADKGRQGKKTYAAPEQLYNLDGAHSVNTIFGKEEETNKEGKGYAGSPGAATINLGKAKTAEVIDGDDDSDGMSALSELSKEDLIALLRKTNISTEKKKAPHLHRTGPNLMTLTVRTAIAPIAHLLTGPPLRVMKSRRKRGGPMADSRHQLLLSNCERSTADESRCNQQ